MATDRSVILEKLCEIVKELYKGNFDKVYDAQVNKEFSRKEFLEGFLSYPGKMTLPPKKTYQDTEIIEQIDEKENIVSYYIDFDRSLKIERC